MRKLFVAINKNWQTANFATSSKQEKTKNERLKLFEVKLSNKSKKKNGSAVELHHGKTFWLVYHFIMPRYVYNKLLIRVQISEIHYMTVCGLDEKSTLCLRQSLKKHQESFWNWKSLRPELQPRASIKFMHNLWPTRNCTLLEIQLITLSLIHRVINSFIKCMFSFFGAEPFLLSS
jgi:hypothetical protein